MPLFLLLAAPLRTATAQGARSPAAAVSGGGVRTQTVGSYVFGGGAVRVDAEGRRVALYAQDGDGERVLVYADAPSVELWLHSAQALVAGNRSGASAAAAAAAAATDAGRVELETPPLTHRDRSLGGSVVLTREPPPAGTGDPRFYLTVVGDSDHIALLPLTPMDARIILAALRRAADEVKR